MGQLAPLAQMPNASGDDVEQTLRLAVYRQAVASGFFTDELRPGEVLAGVRPADVQWLADVTRDL